MQLDIDFADPPRRNRRCNKRSAGLELGHAGAKRAADHADRATPSWSDRALEIVRAYAQANARVTSEQVRAFAQATSDLPPPPDKRAWGTVMLRAKRLGWLRHIGYAPATDPKVHGNPVGVWASHLAG